MNDLMTAVAELLDPASFSPGLTLAAAASILAAAFLRGLTGFGFAIAAVPLLSLFLPPVLAVPLVICLQLLGNLFEIRTSLKECHRPSLSWLTLGALIGTPAGLLALSIFSASAARLAIAAVTVIAVVVLTRGFAFKLVPGVGMTLPAGLVAGLFNGLAGMPGAVAIPYYMASPVSRIAARASLNVFFLVNAVVAVITALSFGLLTWRIVLYAVVASPLMFAGQRLGLHYFHRGSDRTHRLIAMVSLGAIALGAAIKGLSELL